MESGLELNFGYQIDTDLDKRRSVITDVMLTVNMETDGSQ